VKHLFIILFLIAFSLHTNAQSNGSITVGNESRTFTYFVPPTLPPQPSALVFVLHGTTQDGAQIMDISAFNDIAVANNFIVVYPDGVGNIWNVGFDLPGASTANDVGFIEALVDQFIEDFGVDATRVYSCGFSAGGYMSYRLACESSRCFAAVASVSGTMSASWGDTCAPAFSTSAMQIHGTTDLIVPYNGGSSTTGYSVDQVMAKWQSVLNCNSSPTTTDLPNTNLLDFSTVQRIEYNGCNENTELTLLKVSGGGHMWPGTDIILSGIGTINRDISASEEIWNFFSNHQCPAQVNIEEKSNSHIQYTISSSRDLIFNTPVPNAQPFIILDCFGRNVLQGNATSTINLCALSNGLYILNIIGQKPSKFILN
jgi:polyhydroxybutyrate depolymerase